MGHETNTTRRLFSLFGHRKCPLSWIISGIIPWKRAIVEGWSLVFLIFVVLLAYWAMFTWVNSGKASLSMHRPGNGNCGLFHYQFPQLVLLFNRQIRVVIQNMLCYRNQARYDFFLLTSIFFLLQKIPLFHLPCRNWFWKNCLPMIRPEMRSFWLICIISFTIHSSYSGSSRRAGRLILWIRTNQLGAWQPSTMPTDTTRRKP